MRTVPKTPEAEEAVARALGISRNDLGQLARRERARGMAMKLARLVRELLARVDECSDIDGHPAALCTEAREAIDRIEGQEQIPLVKLGPGGDFTAELG